MRGRQRVGSGRPITSWLVRAWRPSTSAMGLSRRTSSRRLTTARTTRSRRARCAVTSPRSARLNARLRRRRTDAAGWEDGRSVSANLLIRRAAAPSTRRQLAVTPRPGTAFDIPWGSCLESSATTSQGQGGTRCPAQSCERCIASYVAVLAQGKTIANHKTNCVIHPKQSTERKREDSVGCRR